MGSWNETCAVSNIGIGEGDKTVTVLVNTSPNSKSNILHGGRYHNMFGLPFLTTYKDCGDFEADADQPAFDVTLGELKKLLVPIEQGENEYHDIPVNIGLMTESYMWDVLREQRLFIKCDMTGKTVQVEALNIRRDVWDHIFNEFTISTSFDRQSYVQMGFEEYLINVIKEYEDKILKTYNQFAATNAFSKATIAETIDYPSMNQDCLEYTMAMSMSDMGIYMRECYGYGSCFRPMDHIAACVRSKEYTKINIFLRMTMMGVWLHSYLTYNNRQITTAGYSGQMVRTKSIRAHANMLLSVCDALDEERRLECEEWGDDYNEE